MMFSYFKIQELANQYSKRFLQEAIRAEEPEKELRFVEPMMLALTNGWDDPSLYLDGIQSLRQNRELVQSFWHMVYDCKIV